MKPAKPFKEFDGAQGGGQGSGRRSLLSRLVLLLGVAALLMFVAGYPAFRSHILSLKAESAEIALASGTGQKQEHLADGIVVLTGDRERIRAGFDMFKKGIAERMLISGVHENVSRQAAFRLGGVSESALPCCVDIGYSAINTLGNAIETAQWARRNDIERLLVVTSDYHMPRSLLELSREMPGVRLIPFAAESGPSVTPFAQARIRATFLRHSLREYGKYLAAHLRLTFAGQRNPAQYTARAAE